MTEDNYLNNLITDTLRSKDNEERKNHKSSGKLSASMLGQPLQWQILKVLGEPQREIDDYTLRKFLRGKDVEKWIVFFLGAQTQKFVEYRNVVGYVDAIVDASGWDCKDGILPLEIKSVANMKFKRIEESGDADRSHKLQACLYALALGLPKFAVCYCASDDYRIKTLIYETEFVAPEVNEIITAFDEQMEKKVVPPFVAAESWQENIKYNNFPLWAGLTEEELKEKSEKLIKIK